jgi:hypothetical protein
MRTVLSYILLLTLTLSGLSGSVQPVYATTLANTPATPHQNALAADNEIPCHSAQPAATDTEHACCEQTQRQCNADCCAKHCPVATALLAAELFRYIRPDNRVTAQNGRLPQWLFADDPPPPINT